MKERPVLFSSPMVRALLDGHKTQTRRVVKPQPDFDTARNALGGDTSSAVAVYDSTMGGIGLKRADAIGYVFPNIHCPYGKPGDRLWVRETWQHDNHPLGPYEPDCTVFYRADYLDDPLGADLERSPDGIRRQWRPSIHMPRAASRISLEITNVRIERLQSIGEADAWAEGVDAREVLTIPASNAATAVYSRVWEEINGAGSWDVNPWVWVVSFRRIS